MDKRLIEEFDKQQKSKKHKRSKDSSHASNAKAKQAKVEEPEFTQPSTSYRDRAKERREGLNKDFELDPDDLIVSNPTLDHSNLDDEDQIAAEEERRRQQIEESKYLGGDVEHTHLVKGLDFALLEKVKNDQKLAEKLEDDRKADRDLMFGEPDSDSEEEEFRNEAILAASSALNSKRPLLDVEKLKKNQSTEIIPCRTALARRVLNVLDEKWPDKSELFLPGRMNYIIRLNDDEDTSVTTVLRSKADTTAIDESALPNESDFALDQLINILAKVRQGGTITDSSKKTSRTWTQSDDANDYGY